MIAGGNHTTIKRAKAIIDQVRHDLGPGPARRAVNDRPYEWMTIDSPKFDGDSQVSSALLSRNDNVVRGLGSPYGGAVTA